ncbi:hypothetical protein CPLU01_11807 [Colletotrichum plurivorum]|uniref:Uncharacterized protein n=1 Tax=Colletotrichum plurivorum TaxID=2175906 RepID=A0A8H6N725_9PEZI|nr:hypothetical protein CPLU01_11807 [Colletotrichum plurivorum]
MDIYAEARSRISSVGLPSQDQILNDIIQTAQDLGRLSNYTFILGLPMLLNPPESPLPCRETPVEADTISADFTAQIRGLLGALESSHVLDAQAIADGKPSMLEKNLALTIKIQRQSFDRHLKCLHRSYPTYTLSLTVFPANLPLLPGVTKLRLFSASNDAAAIHFHDVRPVALSVPLLLLSRFPDLQELGCPWLWERLPIPFKAPSLRHYTRQWAALLRETRRQFRNAVEKLQGQIPAPMTKARLWFWRPSLVPEEDQGEPLPDFLWPLGEDPVSLGLCTLASHLEELDLRAFLTPEIFNPAVPWTRMRRLRVEFHPRQPDGGWYFIGPLGENLCAESPNNRGFWIQLEDYPSHASREEDSIVDDEFLTKSKGLDGSDRESPTLAFAQALRYMPALEEAELFAYLTWKPSEKRKIDYEEDAPYDEGVHRWGLKYTPAKEGRKGLLEWPVGSWRPQAHVTRLFVGGSDGLNVIWKPFEFMDMRPEGDQDAYI